MTFIRRCCHRTGNDLDVLGVELIAADDAGAPRRLAVSEGNQMRLLLIGAPGAGKGTQAERLAERFGITHISSGDLLRQHVKDRTSIGRMVTSYLDHGDLVPDGVVMDMLRKPVVAAAQAIQDAVWRPAYPEVRRDLL